MDKITELTRKMAELLSEYGVDRAGIDAAVELALEYGEEMHNNGWHLAEAHHFF